MEFEIRRFFFMVISMVLITSSHSAANNKVVVIPLGDSSSDNYSAYGSSSTSPNDAVFVNDDGNVGIGTSNPQVPLEIANGVGDDYVSLLASGVGRFMNSIQVDHNIHGGVGNVLSFISTLPNQSNASQITFQTSDGGGQTERMRITPDGLVGIGTDSPITKLDVNGAISVNGRTVIDSSGKWVGEATSGSSSAFCTCGIENFYPSHNYFECSNIEVIKHIQRSGKIQNTVFIYLKLFDITLLI